MLGHYLNGLTVEQEDRVLCFKLAPGWYHSLDDTYCLRGAAELLGTDLETHRVAGLCARPAKADGGPWPPAKRARCACLEDLYDALCARFGALRVNTALRQRILTNRLWRDLRPWLDAGEETLQQLDTLLEVTHG